MIAMPATRWATPSWVWPATMTSTAPAGSARARRGRSRRRPRSCRDRRVDRSACTRRRHAPPPRRWSRRTARSPARRRRSPAPAASPSGRGCWRRCVEVGVARVVTPMTPTLSPAIVSSADGRTFGQSTGRRVASSTTLAASSGKRASAARALSAPRGSSAGRTRRRRLARRTVVELVVADRRRRVAGPRRPGPRRPLRPGSTPGCPGTCPRRRAAGRRRHPARARAAGWPGTRRDGVAPRRARANHSCRRRRAPADRRWSRTPSPRRPPAPEPLRRRCGGRARPQSAGAGLPSARSRPSRTGRRSPPCSSRCPRGAAARRLRTDRLRELSARIVYWLHGANVTVSTSGDFELAGCDRQISRLGRSVTGFQGTRTRCAPCRR